MSSITLDPPACPRCHSPRVAPIVHGLPAHETFVAAEREELELGGCLIWPDSPAYRCRACGAAFGSIDLNLY